MRECHYLSQRKEVKMTFRQLHDSHHSDAVRVPFDHHQGAVGVVRFAPGPGEVGARALVAAVVLDRSDVDAEILAVPGELGGALGTPPRSTNYY